MDVAFLKVYFSKIIKRYNSKETKKIFFFWPDKDWYLLLRISIHNEESGCRNQDRIGTTKII